MKAKERAESGKDNSSPRTLDGLPLNLPALVRAIKLQRRAARVGFDWPDTSHVVDKLNEEMLELSQEIEKDRDSPEVKQELGDLLFVYANLARHLEIDAEEALRGANAKFVRRFEYVEDQLASRGRRPKDSDLEEMDALWNEIRKADKAE